MLDVARKEEVKLTRLKRLREKRAMTQQRLANKAGVAQSEISHLEGGARDPRLSTTLKIAAALEVSVEDLL